MKKIIPSKYSKKIFKNISIYSFVFYSVLVFGFVPITINNINSTELSKTVVPKNRVEKIVSDSPKIGLIKTGKFNDENSNGIAEVGETISYNFVVKNTGQTLLNDILVEDPLVVVKGAPISLNTGQSDSTSFTATYSVTQSDIDKGFVSNQAKATGCYKKEQVDSDGNCEGKVTYLKLKYTGSVKNALITIVQKDGQTIFNKIVQPNEEFQIYGKDKNPPTMGPKINVSINNKFSVEIHTSCSIPIGPGSVFGDFKVIEGESKEGGKLNPVSGYACVSEISDLSDNDSHYQNDPTIVNLTGPPKTQNERDCNCSPFYKNSSFKNPKLISGSALSVGSVYRFANVFPNNTYGTTIDALVKVVQFNGGASLLEIDVTSTGIPEAFQPRINSTNSSDQSVEFSITFVSGGGNYGDEVVISYFASPYDIDGDGNKTREYTEINLPDAYFVSNNALINITQTASVVRGEAKNTSTAPGGNVSLDSRYTYSNYFENKSSLKYKIGKKDGDNDRYYSLDMTCAKYDNPNSVLITYPVICGTVKDTNGNPLSNVKVGVTGSDGSVQNLTTNSSGSYKAIARIPEALVDVEYKIRETDMDGYISVSDVDGANDNLITRSINLISSCGNDFVDGIKPNITVEYKTDILCNGESTGKIKVSGSGGIAPYKFSLNARAPQSNSLFEGLSAGIYTVKLIDASGNTATTTITLNEPVALSVIITKENATTSQGCENGKATATVSGGTAPYKYLWSESAGNQTTQTATNISSGTHTVTITDANNCVLIQGVVIDCSNTCDAIVKVNNVKDVLCAGQATGSAKVSASSEANAAAKFTFKWNTSPERIDSGVTSSTLNGLKAGIYTVSVTIDGTVCQPVEQSVTIVEPTSILNATVSATDERGPDTADGTATVVATGGTPPYRYLWSPGGKTTDRITGLSAGNYTVSITDANDCSVIASVNVNPGTCKNLTVKATASSTSCNGSSDGIAIANVTGGSGSFTYLWSPGGKTTQSISGLSAGNYTITITDTVTKCTVQSTVSVNQPNVLTSGIAISNVLCSDEKTGSLDLTVVGGTFPYQFLWSNGATTEDINNLAAGTYSVLITDAKGCKTSNTAVVRQPYSKLDILIVSQTNIVCNAPFGSVTVNATGGTTPYTYKLNSSYNSTGEFSNLTAGEYSIIALDANGCEKAIEITIVANCTNAENDINTTFTDIPVSGNVLTNDTDPEGDTQRVTTPTVTTTQGVVVTIDPTTGVYTYTPPTGYVGEDRFEYTICDTGTPEACDTATVYIEVLPIGGPENEAPIANADTAGTEKDTPVTGNVLTNDYDPDGDPITVSTPIVTTKEGVEVTIDPMTGAYTYTPPTGFIGDDSFEYTICDNGSPALCDTATVVITVVDNQGNITIANDDAYTTTPGVLVSGNVLDNDSDPEGDTQTVSTTPVSNVTNGLLVLNTDGTFTYTPNDGFIGTDSFIYSVCDNGIPQACDQSTVYITVVQQTPPNTTNAENDINTTFTDIPVSGNVLTNDTDPEGDTQRVTTPTVTTTQGVVVTIDPTTGVYTYTPPTGYVGEDRFEYTICDTGTPEACDTATVYIEVLPIGGPENEAPIANADTAGTEKDTPVTGNVLTNDYDPDGDPITVSTPIVTTKEGVEVTIDPMTGAYTYTPPTGFIGDDSFEYTICDNGSPALCDTATVVITVVDNQGNITIANDDAYTTTPGVLVSGNVLDNDSDPEGDTQTVSTTPVSNVTNGLLVLNTDGTFTYTPNDGFIGTDSFIYSVCDNGIPQACDQATVYITVVQQTPPNTTNAENDINTTFTDIPVSGNVLTNDTDPEGDTQRVTTPTVTTTQGVVVTIDPTTGVYTYTPPTGYVGEDRFEYTICDTGTPEACDTATVYIEVLPIGGPENEAPIANADTAGTEKDTPVTGNVLTNDYDPDGDPITVSTPIVTTKEGVEVTIDPMTGAYTYTPPTGFIGDDSFEYTICDNGSPALCDTATVVITVVDNQGNITIANDDAYTTTPGVLVSGNVLDNDSDPEGDTQTVSTTPVSNVTNGLLVLNTDGTFTYTPNDGFIGTDSFIYSVCDNGIPQACDQSTVYITVVQQTPPNTTNAENDINTTFTDIPVSGNVLTNDTDPEGDTQRVTTPTVTTTQGVVVTIDPTTGVYTYTPPTGYVGEDRFEYTICDTGTPEACDTATVYIEVLPIGGPENEAPIANADTAGTEKDTPVTGNVLTNDYDPDGDPITVSTPIVTTKEGVEVTIDPMTGAYTYTPPTGFIGDDSFEYTICDNGNPALCDTATVVITVSPDRGNISIANDDTYYKDDCGAISGNVLINDSDPEGDSQTINTTPLKNVSNGILVLNSDGIFTYTPNIGFVGTDNFVYNVCDSGTPQACNKATVYLTIRDSKAPSILNCSVTDLTMECSGSDNKSLAESWNLQNIIALENCAKDACDNDLTGQVTSNFDFNNFKSSCGLTGSIDVIYTITDFSGNKTTLEVTLTLVDTIAPDISNCVIDDKNLSCSLVSAKDVASQWNLDNIETLKACVTDGCSTQSVTVTSNYNFDNLTTGSLVVIYTITDACGNASTTDAMLTLQNDAVSSTDIALCIDSEVEAQVFNLFNLLSGNYNTGGTWKVISSLGAIKDGHYFDPKSIALSGSNVFETITFSYTEMASDCPTYVEASIEVNNDCKVLGCDFDNIEISMLLTPNGDFQNDVFKVTGLEGCDFKIDVKIVNRWGAIIFQANDYQNDWNGFAHKSSLGSANQVPSGTYFYVVTLVNSGKAPITGKMYIGTK